MARRTMAAALLFTISVDARRVELYVHKPKKVSNRLNDVTVSPPIGLAPAPGPVYDCETIPTYGLSSSFSCKWAQAWASCFSLDPRTKWHCANMKSGPDWLSQNFCETKKDGKGNWYDGRCIRPKHKDYAKAKKWDGGGVELTRTWVPKYAKYKPKYLKTMEDLPPVSADAIGWEPTSKKVGKGCKFEIAVPRADWKAGTCSSPSLEINVLSYNLFWWQLFEQWQGASGSAGKHIKATGPFDLMGFQECGDASWALKDAGLANDYETFSGNNAVAVAWKKSAWENVSTGVVDVAEDGKLEHWGYREAVWARLKHTATGKHVFFLNHHGPTPVKQAGGLCGPEATAYQLLKIIGERAHRGDSVILIGDFNAKAPSPYDTLANTTTLSILERHLELVYRGIDFGGIDNFYTNCAQALEKKNLNKGHIDIVKWKKGRMVYGGSDHDALSVKFKV